jgi:hypothetical protein
VLEYAGSRRACRKLLRKRDEILARIRRARRDIDQTRDLRIGACFTDHGAAPGMRHQHRRAVLLRQNAAGLGNGIFQRGQRILYRGDMKAGRLKLWNDLRPARSVGPRAVYQHDIPRLDRTGGQRRRGLHAERSRKDAGNDCQCS